MANKADVQEALATLRAITNNPNLLAESVGGLNVYLLVSTEWYINGVHSKSQIMLLGKTSTQVHTKLLDLIQAHGVLTEIEG
jgi:hypothetical protein